MEEDKLKREEEKRAEKSEDSRVLQASQAYIAPTARTAALRTACITLEITSMWNLQKPTYSHT